MRIFLCSSELTTGISSFRRMRVISLLAPRTEEKRERTTGVPSGHRIFVTASWAVLLKRFSPSTACIKSQGSTHASWAGDPGRTSET